MKFTDLPIHTLDNVPPVTLALDVSNVTGTSAKLLLTLNEPGTAYFMLLEYGANRTALACPATDQVRVKCRSYMDSEASHLPYQHAGPTGCLNCILKGWQACTLVILSGVSAAAVLVKHLACSPVPGTISGAALMWHICCNEPELVW